MARTKKSGASGKYGARYGATMKKEMNKIIKAQKTKYTCPECQKKTLKRISSGVWECTKCGAKIAGKAFTPN